MSYKIKSNLSEKQIETDVAQYFSWISAGAPFRLLDIDEQLTGSDKAFFDSGFSFFMQFKVSDGLEPISKIPISTRSNKSKLEDIRLFRSQKGLDDDPTFYFQLRKMAKTAIDYQHNILLKHANQHHSQAFYVAPLHVDKNEYYNCLFNSAIRFRNSPFTYNKYRLFTHDWVSHLVL